MNHHTCRPSQPYELPPGERGCKSSKIVAVADIPEANANPRYSAILNQQHNTAFVNKTRWVLAAEYS